MRVFVTAALLLVSAMVLRAEKHARLPPVNVHAGVVERVFKPSALRDWRGGKHELDVTVWYPAAESAAETAQWIGPAGTPLFHAGMAAKDAAIAEVRPRYPLIVLSHGSGGSAQQMAWLGTALARAGFVAAAVSHPGNNATESYTAQGFVLWWERATDLSQVIDGMLADGEFGPRIDKERIGAAGFSLGGYTVMELAGARTDISVVVEECREKPDLNWCQSPEMKTLGSPLAMLETARKTSAVSLARSGESYADARVNAVFAIAPGIEEALTPESLKAIRLPVEVVVGEADRFAPRQNDDYLRAHVRGLRETVLPGGVGHYTFLDTCTAAGKETLGVDCSDDPGVDREAVHARVSGMAVEFFRKMLDVM